MRSIRGIVFLLASLALTGCIVIPVVVPPVRVQQNFGVATGRLASDQLRSLSDQHSAFAMTTRIGLHPMQLFPSLFHRQFDLGAGYLIEATPTSPLSPFWKHGPYLELGYHFWTVPIDQYNQWFVRASTSVHGDLLFANNLGNTIGFGTGVSLTLELVSFAAGAGARSSVNDRGDISAFVGGIGGEWGGGITAGIDYRTMDGASYGVFNLGLVFRFPGVAGLVLVTDSTNRSSSGSGDARPARTTTPAQGNSQSVEVRSPTQPSRPSVEVRGTN